MTTEETGPTDGWTYDRFVESVYQAAKHDSLMVASVLREMSWHFRHRSDRAQSPAFTVAYSATAAILHKLEQDLEVRTRPHEDPQP
jgi:hypothetical protein